MIKLTILILLSFIGASLVSVGGSEIIYSNMPDAVRDGLGKIILGGGYFVFLLGS